MTLTNYSVLVGANNEGKSNILHALSIGMEVLEGFKYSVRRDSRGRIVRTQQISARSRSGYNWQQDFPLSKQTKPSKEQCTEIFFEFKLSEKETDDFQAEIGSKLNGTLPVLIKLSKTNYEVVISKQGRGGATLNKKTTKIADFVSRRISFEYIPAIRTSDSAESVVSDLLYKELSRMEENEEYKIALAKIDEIQRPIFETLSKSISATISSFLPSVTGVEISMPRDARIRAMRRGISIEVDDGNKTSLDRKGDGVKSLVALALMRHASESVGNAASSIVAIEEPEAHLHPQAIHELRDVLLGLSKRNQVILTTHSPLFVNPANLDSTIVVQRSKAAIAENISEVRQVLGVRLSDNLQSARLVAIVEGDDDVITLEAILRHRYPKLKTALDRGDLVFDALGGASKLTYNARMYRSSATLVQCFLDSDDAGKTSIEIALSDSVIRDMDYNLINVLGQKEAELEDLFDAKKYKAAFISEFAVDPTITPPGAKGQKWSVAMEKKFLAHGKIWNKPTEGRVKLWLARHVTENVDDIIIESRFGPIDAFANSLMSKLQLH